MLSYRLHFQLKIRWKFYEIILIYLLNIVANVRILFMSLSLTLSNLL